MVWSVRQQHRVAEEFEQAARGDAAHLQRFGFHLSGAWIGDQPFDVGRADDDICSVAARDDGSQWPVTPKDAVGVPVEVGHGHDDRLGASGILRRIGILARVVRA
jgi:hypothetical protein